MAFLLQDGALYIPNRRAYDVWDTLIANPASCSADRTVRLHCMHVIVRLPCILVTTPTYDSKATLCMLMTAAVRLNNYREFNVWSPHLKLP